MEEFIDNLVSIVTPVFNAEDFLVETIESVLYQSYEYWELILIDDCSKDRSLIICNDFEKKDQRIKVITLEENQGAAVARNEGIHVAKGRYIAFIDSDDTWHSDKLREQINFMEANQYAFTYTDFATVDTKGNIIKEESQIPACLSYYQLLKNTAIACSTVMIDRQIVGDFSMPLVRKGQDTATWLMLMREHNLTAFGLQKVLNYYRQVPGSISSNRFGALKRTWHTYYHLEKLGFFKAFYYFIHYVWNAIRRRI